MTKGEPSRSAAAACNALLLGVAHVAAGAAVTSIAGELVTGPFRALGVHAGELPGGASGLAGGAAARDALLLVAANVAAGAAVPSIAGEIVTGPSSALDVDASSLPGRALALRRSGLAVSTVADPDQAEQCGR